MKRRVINLTTIAEMNKWTHQPIDTAKCNKTHYVSRVEQHKLNAKWSERERERRKKKIEKLDIYEKLQ